MWAIFSKVLLAVLILLSLVVILPLAYNPSPMGTVKNAEDIADQDSRFVHIDGIKVHYKVYGSGEPALVLLHGFGSNLYSWDKVILSLSEQRKVVAYDWVGFGLTERPLPGSWEDTNPYGTTGQVNTLIGLMDALKIQQAILVGNSAGALIAGETALRCPDRIKGLILVDPALQAKQNSKTGAWMKATPQMDRIGPLISRLILSRGDDLIRSAWHDPSLIQSETMEQYHRPLQMVGWDFGLWEFTKAERVNVMGKVGQFTLPVLIMTGSDDRIIPTKNTIELYRWIPGAELVIIDDAGHVPQEERPEKFIEELLTFIQKITK